MTYLRRHSTLDDAMQHVRRVVGSAGLAPGSRHNSWHGNGWKVRLTRTDLLYGIEHILVTVEDMPCPDLHRLSYPTTQSWIAF